MIITPRNKPTDSPYYFFTELAGLRARIQDDLLYVNPLVPQGRAEQVGVRKEDGEGAREGEKKGKGEVEGVGEATGREEGAGGAREVGGEERGEGGRKGRRLEASDDWSYFCLDRVRYHDRWITIIWDRDGTQYQRGKGMSVSTEIPSCPSLFFHFPFFTSSSFPSIHFLLYHVFNVRFFVMAFWCLIRPPFSHLKLPSLENKSTDIVRCCCTLHSRGYDRTVLCR